MIGFGNKIYVKRLTYFPKGFTIKLGYKAVKNDNGGEKMRKRSIAFVVCLALLGSLFVITGFAADKTMIVFMNS